MHRSGGGDMQYEHMVFDGDHDRALSFSHLGMPRIVIYKNDSQFFQCHVSPHKQCMEILVAYLTKCPLSQLGNLKWIIGPHLPSMTLLT